MSISLDIRDGLPFVSVILEVNHRTIVIEDVLIDTGSSEGEALSSATTRVAVSSRQVQ